MKSYLITMLIFLTLSGSFTSLWPEEKKKEEGRFRFAFVTIDTRGQVMEIKEDIKISSDSKTIFFLQNVKNVYLYLFLLDEQNTLTLLFPDFVDELGKEDIRSDKHFFPEQGRFSELLKGPGKYRLFLLASTSPLIELDEAILNYFKNNKGKRDNSSEQYLIFIKRAVGESLLGNLISVKPVHYIGTVRTDKEKIIDEAAREYKFTNIFSKVYFIEYK